MTEPGDGREPCGALMGTFYGDDGSAEDDLCDCGGYAGGGYTGAVVSPPTFDTTHWYDRGGVIHCGSIWISNESGEDDEVTPWPF